MNIKQLRHGVAVWIPSGAGWIPATVTAHDESESETNPVTGGPGPAVVTVEVALDREAVGGQFQKVEARVLRPRDPNLGGRDRPE